VQLPSRCLHPHQEHQLLLLHPHQVLLLLLLLLHLRQQLLLPPWHRLLVLLPHHPRGQRLLHWQLPQPQWLPLQVLLGVWLR
jgi:hypothetical protein